MDSTVRTVDLANRVLAYREYGDPDGLAVLYQHSMPSSSLEAAYIDDAARERGLRIIAIDRPGMGDSSMSPNRSIPEMVRDVGVLINRLDIDSFGVLALGGGAPYAWVLGQGMAHRVRALAVVSGETPGHSHVVETAKAFMALGTLPFTKRRFLDPAKAERAWADAFKDAPAADQEAAADPDFRAVELAALANAFAEGSGGAAKDVALVHGAKWGFPLTEVDVAHTLVWHGSADPRVSLEECRRVTDQVPGADVRVLEGEGHVSTWTRHRDEILDALAAAMREAS